jgi:hypothetical protein
MCGLLPTIAIGGTDLSQIQSRAVMAPLTGYGRLFG